MPTRYERYQNYSNATLEVLALSNFAYEAELAENILQARYNAYVATKD